MDERSEHHMNSMMKTLSALLILSVPVSAHAAGFAVYEHSAPATGRVGGITATVDDASAVFYNPAAITEVKGGQILVGLTLIRPVGKYVGVGLPSTRPPGVDTVSQRTEGTFLPVPALFYAREISSKASLGVGVYAPYGLKLDWGPEGFV